MSAKIAVLGLVIEEPGPAYRLTAKLRQRLTSARFADSNVYAALGRLEREGLICGTSGSDARRFEATPAGVRFFEQWLLESSAVPPLRDELHLKVALCQPPNLKRLVELVYGQEIVCLARVEELKRCFEDTGSLEPHHWRGLVMVHLRDAELTFWESRITWLQGVRASLERMHEDFQRTTGKYRPTERSG